ncbi:serine protease [Phellopilus nigrolimitatus]|nr:serine protease [Phellopilus nigrolimitatus]
MLTVQTYSGPKNEGSFIVKLKAGVDKDATLRWLNTRRSGVEITHGSWNSTFFHGFAGKFDADTIDVLRANTDVESIHEDGIATIESTVTQTNAPWGLSRISQDERLSYQVPGALTFSYRYDSSAEYGVDIYILDTGIYTAHTDFGGRARWGATFVGDDADGRGHGTHVAGIAAGTRFGVAKAANLIAVKVLADNGAGPISATLSGLNYVFNSALGSGRPSIANLSLSASPNQALDDGVTSLVNLGIHVTVAAGNQNIDAINISPARAPGVITVGASNIADNRWASSNFGSSVNIFAPGENIISTWIGSTSATLPSSGTSMASPHVAGLIAYLISVKGALLPAEMRSEIDALSVKGALADIPSGTPNELARNDIA